MLAAIVSIEILYLLWMPLLSRGSSVDAPFVALLLGAFMTFYLAALWTLERAGVTAFKTRASLEDAHTVRLAEDGRTVTADKILIATGGRPNLDPRLPGIEHAKFWREQADGTVVFSANGTDPIVTFSVADGDGYESYAPAAPLLALSTGE